MAEFIIKPASWDADKSALMTVRNSVFVLEQKVPSSLESDDYDPVSTYVLAESADGTPIGCARLQPNGKVTRIAVLSDWRRRGIAEQMLGKVIEIASKQGLTSLYLHAQLTAISLYEQHGFVQRGAQFEEAGIQHIKMTREIS